MNIKKVITRALLLSLVLVILLSPAGLAEYLFGHDSLYMGDEWMKVTDQAIHYYAEEQGWEVMTQNADFSVESQIKQLRYFVENGADGILWSPVDAQATADIAEYCEENGVPTVTYNTDVNSEAVAINIRFGAKEAATMLAESVIEYLEETYGNAEGVVISLQGDSANDSDRERAEGYKEVFTKYEDIEFVEYYTKSDASIAQRNAFNAIQEYGRPVAIVSQNTLNARGGMQALDRADMLVPRGEEDHVFIASIGASPDYIDSMDEGFVDRGLVQPNLFYGPLAMHFLTLIIEEGVDALPEVGETITEDDLKITGGTHDGVTPWETQVWAPATVEENYGHKWLKVQGMLVTPENMHDPTIWGNTAKKWLD
ncbi:MAG: sugar ABC transporter substrate-binding protein [Bacillota bacterium]